MPHFIDTVASPAPPERAFDYLANFASVAAWDPSVSRAEALDEGGPRVGARYRVTVRVLGRESDFIYETIALERPRRVVLRAETSSVVSLDTITFAPSGAGTDVTYDARLTLKGPVRLAELPMRIVFGRLARRAKAGLERELGRLEAAR